jgi:hypothetical protein
VVWSFLLYRARQEASSGDLPNDRDEEEFMMDMAEEIPVSGCRPA